jgi:hypothetical protein
MGSDFQRVEILEVDKAASVIVVQITEIHPDADAIHRLLGKTGEEYLARALAAPLRKTTIPRGKAYYARNFAAQLLADYGKSGLLAAAEAEEDEDDPNPNDFISRVVVRVLEPLDKATNESWLYRATLAITLVRPDLAEGFVVGKCYDSRAFPTSDWEL